ncbi:MAG: ArdC family protein [Clostridiales bacterium]|nr:ArdC family protein [Clostridiales bacterium]
MSESTGNKIYDKLTPQRKQLVDEILKNLESGTGLWRQGWQVTGAPVSAITGKRYNGVNRLFLTAAMMQRGYSDNRWLTYNQMEEKGWHFKKDAEGNNLGKGAGVAIEYFELRDKLTNKPFDRHVLDGMTSEEKNAYMDENTFPLRKYYRVFNGDIIDGILF